MIVTHNHVGRKGRSGTEELKASKGETEGNMERSANLVVEGDEAHADVGTLHAKCLDALQHGLLDKLGFNQIILCHHRYLGCRDTSACELRISG